LRDTTVDVMSNTRRRLLVGASGAAAVAGLPAYLTALHSELDAQLTFVMTRSARQFLPEDTVALHAERVVTGEDPARWPTDNQAALALSHDAVLVLPSTANMLAAAATGAAPNLLGGVILAVAGPVVFFPVMSPTMWAKPPIRRNIEQLRRDGYHVVEPVWADRYDFATRTSVKSPALPPPPAVVVAVREVLAGA
jgi:phosphopantothenoylcysteine decarboxylase